MVIGVGDLKKGVTIELDGQPYQVIDYSKYSESIIGSPVKYGFEYSSENNSDFLSSSSIKELVSFYK